MQKHLADVGIALDFLSKATSDKTRAAGLEATTTHQEVIKLAAEQGQTVTRETLAEAMKILVDRQLAGQGIPSWVRARVHVAVHD